MPLRVDASGCSGLDRLVAGDSLGRAIGDLGDLALQCFDVVVSTPLYLPDRRPCRDVVANRGPHNLLPFTRSRTQVPRFLAGSLKPRSQFGRPAPVVFQVSTTSTLWT
ncbi:hypothetical protein [Nocardia terpenica]|uniref:Uncharacterized protein n=1 Tax=Nocardia terpenica TaxID=455432 RepID=A0A6G9ZAV6_9NOCA|nr:hypothetical protein [Nocardia terpenica]QIS22143.1 hypothetical protein F6W96_31165 [Nocardia terpenica]